MHSDEAIALLQSTFPESDQTPVVIHAPGRTNLIGEHTDYNDGFVFPVAINQGITLAARPNGTDQCRLVSAQAGKAEPFPLTAQPGEVKDWAKYAAGMAWVLNAKTGVDVALTSDLPMASGVSSSAALEMAFGVLWNELDNLGHDNKTLALLAQKCENQFVGVNCGIMDQMASAMGKQGHALLLDTRSLEITYAPVPDGIDVFILDTGKSRELADSAYNDRRASCEAAAKTIGVKALRDATLQDLAKLTDPVQFKRARHIITENERCLQFSKALNAQDLKLVGKLMGDSHISLRDDYEVSCQELDIMVEAALQSPGCIGARMTGAGFGGCCVALVHTQDRDRFQSVCEQNYLKQVLQYKPAILGCTAAQGAHRVS